jgi:hypothetical protein
MLVFSFWGGDTIIANDDINNYSASSTVLLKNVTALLEGQTGLLEGLTAQLEVATALLEKKSVESRNPSP